MDIYMVGGAVRDALLGLPVTDCDWVVVGGTPQAMLAQGYQSVGKDFPVFLHPRTHEEYALARTERKTGPGYHGFACHAAPDVTLEQDLGRRDLTINSIAAIPILKSDGSHFYSKGKAQPDLNRLTDPYGGLADLRAGVLRHVSDAFREDPVRILRLARFAARFPHFTVAPDTMALMREMVDAGEASHLVAERVWQEVSRGLMTDRPSRMFEVLRACGALAVLLPELDRLWGVPQRADYHPEVDTGVHAMMVLDHSAHRQTSLAVRFACLCHDFGKGTTPADVLPRHIGHEERSLLLLQGVAQRWRVPKDCKELAEVVAKEHGNIHRCRDFSAAALLRLLARCDAIRRPERFHDALEACLCDARGRLNFETAPYPQAERLRLALQAAQSVPTDTLAADTLRQLTGTTGLPAGKAGQAVAQAINGARERAIHAALSAA
ncbi:MAG TPA: multifunctional CCA addition/repair protein [Burkholderiaceae bacterium]|nr:multifunctional CCA addition/repair protein [Burkholderiaceae bacterium]